jgi:lysophospholipase L1-like esterase
MSDPAQPDRRKLPILHKVLMAATIALVLSEIGVRVVDHNKERTVEFFLPPDEHLVLLQTHPYIGFMYRPGAERTGGMYSSHINSLGMRGPELAMPKSPGTYRILCVGGSTTFSTGATADEKSYPARMQHYLNELAPEGVRLEVGNCGVTGYTTAENLINLQLRLVEFEPDAIVIYQAANDARPIQARGFQPDYAHYRRTWPLIEVSPFERWMISNVRLFAWLTRGLDPEKQYGSQSNRTFVDDFKELHVPSHQGVPPEGLDVFFRNLAHMVLVAREHGIEPVLSTFASCPEKQPDDEHFSDTVAAINERLAPFAAERNVPLLLIAEQLDDQCDLFDDWMHLGDDGSDAHGRVAAEEAARLGLFGL